MKTAIYFHPESYDISGPKLMGRHSAGESFLRGYLKYSNQNEWCIYVNDSKDAEKFVQTAQRLKSKKTTEVVLPSSLKELGSVGNLYYPGPDIAELAYHRETVEKLNDQNGRVISWSLCGITHTTSSKGAMDAIANIVTAPVMPWDALICTSNSVRSNVIKVIEARIEELRVRLGITRVTLPHLPVIPLAIHADDFEFSETTRANSRKILCANPEEIVVLFMGRLSFHAKSHPLSMYQALEKASKKTGKSLVLVECGWFANDHIQKAYESAAQLACPSIRIVHLDGRNAENRKIAWSSADIFCSLSDNIQETFGITPLEAMATGLPLVVSDWDGYRDTVRQGIDGFRVSTCMPISGSGIDLALRHAMNVDSYDMYCGHTSSLVSVNIEEAQESFVSLVSSHELRKKMGEAGRLQVKKRFDWSVVIPQYESLWETLHEQRQKTKNSISGPDVNTKWAARLDPFDSFEAYPTTRLREDTILTLGARDPKEVFDEARKFAGLAMVSYASYILPKESEALVIIEGLRNGPASSAQLLTKIKPERRMHVFRSIAWLLKMGVVKLL